MKANITREASPREVEVLRGIARKESTAEIAQRLHISKGTVRHYLRGIYQAYGVGTREDAVRVGRLVGDVTDACPTCGRGGSTQ